jgi:RimJ/RimL family protein N-acetyltransferase
LRFPDDVPVLSDGQVRLRAHRQEDIDAITEQCQDDVMQRWTLVPVPYSREDAQAFIDSRAAGWEEGSTYSFAIESPEGVGPTNFAGSIGLVIQGPGIGGVAFGTHPAARGHGVMTTAVRLVADWAFESVGVQRLTWSCIVGNLASWRVAWHNGFRFDGSLRRTEPQRGELLDSWNASLLSTDDREPTSRWLPHPTVSDGTVRLRPLEARDERRYLEAVFDPETHYWLHEIPFARDPAAFQLRVLTNGLAASLGQAVEWAIADADSDEYLGGVNLFGFGGLDHNSAEIGYRTHPAARKRGVMRRAMRLALDLAFRPADHGGYALHRVSLDAGEGNVGSQAVARVSGFTETGRDRQVYLLQDGSLVDLVRFDLLADEWRDARNDPDGPDHTEQ